jgi:hypothetical protein
MFTLASFLKITEVAHKFVLIFFDSDVYALMFTKKGWATFWAIFSLTHLVTLDLHPLIKI